jgi:hypothetical protein
MKKPGPNSYFDAARHSLSSIGEPAVPYLTSIIKDYRNTHEFRIRAIDALQAMAAFLGPEIPQASVPTLITMLEEGDKALRVPGKKGSRIPDPWATHQE